jgi:hypothetical protein
MSGLIAMDTGLRRGRGIYVRRGAVVERMLRSPQKLGGFEYHLDDVLVAMRLGGQGRQGTQKEDVHPVAVAGQCAYWYQVFAAIRRGDASSWKVAYVTAASTTGSCAVTDD